MKKNSFFKILMASFLGSIAFLGINSCSSEVKGCNDPLAETYDPKTTSNDETLCVYARDKFVGSYKGTFICPNALNSVFNNSDFSYSIFETAAGTVKEVTLQLAVLGVPTNLAGKIEGSVLTVDQTLKNLPFTLPGASAPVLVDLVAKGTANLGTDKKTMTGLINLQIKQGANTLAVDNCPITGTKQ
jgi:hypothetical protein